jgi:SAM-dependent methyltransferase
MSARLSHLQPAKRRLKVIPRREPKPPPVHPFDLLHGTDTGGLIPRAQLVIGHPNDLHITAYYAVAASILDTLVDLWQQSSPAYPIDRYTFLDVGAGKGRAMLIAALHPFREVVGIEMNPTMAAIARANIAIFENDPNTPALAPLSLIEADALEAPLPSTPTLAFMFHPFEAPVVRHFIARVEQHYADRPGSFDLLYVNAEHANVLDRNPAFTRLFNGMVPMSIEDHRADLAEIAGQREYGSTGDELCTIFRFTGRPTAPTRPTSHPSGT